MRAPRFMIASDLHGAAGYTRRLIEAWERERSDMLILLGDLLYHGPRNDLPDEYDPKAVIRLLSPLAPKILAVRGNCDTEVDQMVLPFPLITISKRRPRSPPATSCCTGTRTSPPVCTARRAGGT